MFSVFISLHKAYIKPTYSLHGFYMEPTGHTDISAFLAEESPLAYNNGMATYRFNSLENLTATQPSVKHDP